jgi:phosphomannomutase
VSTIKFGTDGWRGVIADDFTFANVRKVACAIARYVVRAEKPNAGVLVGYDTRYASERFARAAAEVVSMTGMPVWVAEKACPSPALSLLVRQRAAAGGIMITASPQSVPVERRKIQSELWKFGAPFHRRASREGTCLGACEWRATSARAP